MSQPIMYAIILLYLTPIGLDLHSITVQSIILLIILSHLSTQSSRRLPSPSAGPLLPSPRVYDSVRSPRNLSRRFRSYSSSLSAIAYVTPERNSIVLLAMKSEYVA